MIVYIITRERLYIGSEVMSVWRTQEAAEEEIKVLQEYYGGKWAVKGVSFWINDTETVLQIEAKLVRG